MSILFGKWDFDGRPIDPADLVKFRSTLSSYGTDRIDFYSRSGIAIYSGAFYTTWESRLEKQPLVLPSGAVLTWDGRLDNRSELIGQFPDCLTVDSCDADIVATIFHRWGPASFAKILGDWALSIWNPSESTLLLARDPVGVRHLYYTFERSNARWSTFLAALLPSDGRRLTLDEEYLAGWLSFLPAGQLTPFREIRSVPPSSYVLIQSGTASAHQFWRFSPDNRILYKTDQEYEEHFRYVFAESVRRRLRSDSPILAELSGGMDSSSIVCVADTLMASGMASAPRLDTASIFDDREPNSNERPFVTIIEEQRGRTGLHVDADSEDFRSLFETDRLCATPDSIGTLSKVDLEFRRCMAAQTNRVILSGIGGDEMTGGIPTRIPELADLTRSGRFGRLAHELKVAAIQDRRPWLHLFIETLQAFFPPVVGLPRFGCPLSWLSRPFATRYQKALSGYETRLQLFGPRPSFQFANRVFEGVRRQLASMAPLQNPPYETRYPFLDRGLLEFLIAIPFEQLVRPGQRRSLLRRSLAGIVPNQILNRKRKAFVSRAPLKSIAKDWTFLDEVSKHMVAESIGVVEPEKFRRVLENARSGYQVPLVFLLRTITLEAWLRHISDRIIVDKKSKKGRQDSSTLALQANRFLDANRNDLS